MEAAQGSQVILGTSSRFRRRVMDELTTEYSVRTADIDEKAIRHEDPSQLVMLLAHAKADAIVGKMRAAGEPLEGLLLTCDQVVTFRGEIREKPEDEAECRRFIREYSESDQPVCTVSAVLATHLASGQRVGGVDVAEIHFGEIPPEAEDRVIADGEVLWCAGGLQAEHPAIQPCITRQVGTQDSIMGLPKSLVVRLVGEAAARGHQ